MFQGMEYVYEVYREGSFRRAAQKLFISQPSLSASVKRVEKRIGCEIFDRSVKPLRLTECGEKYIETVQKMMELERAFANYVNDWGGLRCGSLTVGGSSLFSSLVLPSIMSEFSLQYPGIHLELVEETTAKLENQLQSGEVDLVMDYNIPNRDLYDSAPFEEEQLFLAVPAGFAVNSKLEQFRVRPREICSGIYTDRDIPPVPLEMFCNLPFIVLKPENDTRRRAMEICAEHHFVPNIVFELDQQMTSYHLSCSGIGISFISSTLASRIAPDPAVAFYRLSGKHSRRAVRFYWKKGRYFTRAMETFLRLAGALPDSRL